MTEDQLIDLDLVNQVLEHIPRFAWTVVRDAIITNLVDSMPIDVVETNENQYIGNKSTKIYKLNLYGILETGQKVQ